MIQVAAMPEIRIDPEFQSLIPPLTIDERAQLEANISRDGCREPIVLWGDLLLDGHNRYEICSRLNLNFGLSRIVLADRDEAKLWIIRNQFGRRNLQPYQRAELAEKLRPILAAKAERRMLSGVASPDQNSDQGRVNQELAKLSGLSHDTIHKAKVISEHATQEVQSKLRRGETSINREYDKIKLQDRDDKKKAELHQVVEIVSRGIVVGDFREKASAIADASVELVFIDPPYDRDSIPLYEDAARIASRILKPGGSLISYCGQVILPDILQLMQKHLRYWWLNACVHADGKLRMQKYGIVNDWKPMLWFVNGSRGDCQTFLSDVVTGGREKSHHEWQQAESEASYYIDKLTGPNGLVVDFFAGGGTTCIAALRLGRPWLAFEINPVTAHKADQRIRESL